jgi:hypothetical protein
MDVRVASLLALCACGTPRGDAAADGSIDGASLDAPACMGSAAPETIEPVAELTVAADASSVYGISDPSLSWPTGSANGFMSYTSLQSDRLITRIASTSDGQTFTYATDANTITDLAVSTTDTTVCGSTSCTGRIVHETSSLIYDATDPDPSARFKLFDYSYVIVPSAGAQHAWGYIGLYTASTGGGTWSAGTKALGWTSTAAAISETGVGTLLSNTPALADCAAFTEPAAFVPASGAEIDLALGCVSAATGTPTPRVILLRSTDHAATFSYVGLLLSPADGTSIGSTTPGAEPTDMFDDNGTTYLVVSTLGTTPMIANAGNGYTSCTTVAIADLATAAVARGADGTPTIVRELVAPSGGFAGACSFKPEFATGYLIDEENTSSPPNRLLASDVRCP